MNRIVLAAFLLVACDEHKGALLSQTASDEAVRQEKLAPLGDPRLEYCDKLLAEYMRSLACTNISAKSLELTRNTAIEMRRALAATRFDDDQARAMNDSCKAALHPLTPVRIDGPCGNVETPPAP
jgi:hypothetical protein